MLTGVDITDYGRDLPGRPLPRPDGRPAARPGAGSAPPAALLGRSGRAGRATSSPSSPRSPGSCPTCTSRCRPADDLILKRMKRRHLRADVARLCDRLRQARPDIAFGADLIAGFPTETEDMFQDSLSAVEDCDLAYLHVFPYSARPGTPAARMPQVPKAAPARPAPPACARPARRCGSTRFLASPGRHDRPGPGGKARLRPHASTSRRSRAWPRARRRDPARAHHRGGRGPAGRASGVGAMSEVGTKSGWLARLRAGLARSTGKLGDGIAGIFTRRKLDDDALEELEELLISADLGVATAAKLTENLAKTRFDKEVSPEEVRAGAGRRHRRPAGPGRPAAYARRRQQSPTWCWWWASTAAARPRPSASSPSSTRTRARGS